VPLLSVPLRSVPLHVRPRRSIATACACGDTVSGSVSSCRARELKTTRACESAARDLRSILPGCSLVACAVSRCTGTGSRSYFRGRRRAGGPRATFFRFADHVVEDERSARSSDARSTDPSPTEKSTRHASSWPVNTEPHDVRYFGTRSYGTIYASKRAAPPHTHEVTSRR